MGLADETVEFFSTAARWPENRDGPRTSSVRFGDQARRSFTVLLISSKPPPARLTHLRNIAVLGLLAYHGIVLASPLLIEGSYVAKTLNGRPLPADLRLTAVGGDFRLFRLEQGVLRLSSGGRFTLYFRDYHQLVRRGSRPTSTPVLSDSESGTYKLEMGKLILTPMKKSGAKARPPIAATIAGKEIRASYLLQSGGTQQLVMLTLERDASFW